MHANGFQTIFQELYVCQYTCKIVGNQLACMIVLQSMWKGPNHCWNFMESGSESATYVKEGDGNCINIARIAKSYQENISSFIKVQGSF